MPRTPAPDEGDLDSIPPPHPVFHVEQALLGALLLDPQYLRDVTGIGPDAFSTAAHGALFAAIRSLPAPDPAEHAKSTKWLVAVLNSAREQARGLTAPYLHSLIQICPWPRHAPAYARMIEAEHSRRRLAAAAQRLAHTAGDTTFPQRVATTLAEADALALVVDDISARFPPHAGSLPRTSTPEPVTAHDEDAVDEERLLLATATAHPSDVEQMRWLIPGDFTQPLHAGLWQSLITLTRRHAPVDPVTVLWEARHRGLLGPGAEPQELLELLAGPVGSSEHWAERVLQRSLLTTIRHVGRRIEAFTDDPATTPYQLVVGSRRALADLSAVRTRWQHATSSPAPAGRPARTRAAKATAAPRAGPPRTTAPPASRSSR
ncbi:DnaB-like helicase N-terminal domain-containing protein [Streptomyces sp. H27-C3]|uniref:DnaB-like helicase N-terminal domain-containing protein n=1 Tax=Streptomyces sp. H27-C3 TaxID=3046305 RepID=UPI0024BB3DE5|nr:DnaB-like helicase N-terminal domain-containing protein [Streptomyces sp. H27-C3]MDJ0464716.1 DnaB-like helicase N-terminal domain-containing protein [Streptomyces sp. H27-C3]